MKTAGKFIFHKAQMLKGLMFLWIPLCNFKYHFLPNACYKHLVVGVSSFIAAQLPAHLSVEVRLSGNLVMGRHRTLISVLESSYKA